MSIPQLDDDDIEKLDDFQHARLRTEMWLGSRDPNTLNVLEYEAGKPKAVETTWVPAVFTAFREILDNALDEMITRGYGDRLDVSYDPATATFMIKDNGRGIPINFNEKHKQYSATMAMTETKAGRNFKDRGNSRGLNGVGGSVVNFCSEYLTIDVIRDKKHFNQRFNEGTGEKLIIEDPIIMPTGSKDTGTKVKVKLSHKVFHDLTLPESFIKARVFEVALCYPKLKVYYNGKLVSAGKQGVEKTLFGDRKPITITVDAVTNVKTGTILPDNTPEVVQRPFLSKFWLVPAFFESSGEHTHSLVNCIPTFHGGKHVDTFKRGFFAGMLSALASKSKAKKLNPNRSDMEDGMLIYNITEMDSPAFDSQSKTRLINEEVASVIRKALDDPDFFKGVIRRNPEWVDMIYARCAERTKKTDDAEANKLAKKNLRTKVADLEDASGADRSKCILFIAEGKSAVAGMVEARNAMIHGGLPLRGKVLNVFEESTKTVLENKALSSIMKAVGLIPGQRVNRHQLRYGKIYITTDADEDGKNIAALLINFFFTMWPELFDPEKPPYVYLFDTPLIVAVKGKTRKYWYNEDYDDFNPEQYKDWKLTRAKGLAALKKDDWKWVLENPKATPITDDGELKEAMNLLFNPKLADKRKEWIGM
jgi:DNA gyrase/topoisomerase IV subunit B